MSFLTRLFRFGLVLVAFVVVACEEESAPPWPEPPPQISVVYQFTRNPNPADTVTGLQSNDVYDIIVDSNDKTWVATNSGVSRFIGRQGDGIFNQNNVLPNPKCRVLLEHNNKIWIGTWGVGGVGVYHHGSDSWSTLDSDSGLVDDSVADIAAVGDSIFFATNNGVSMYLDDDAVPMRDRWQDYGFEDGLLTPLVSCVEIAHRPSRMEIWFGSRAEEMIPPGDEDQFGITVLREGMISQPVYYTTVNSGIPEVDINDIVYQESEDLFWIAMATKGLAAVDVDGSTWTIYTTADGLPSDVIYSIAIVDDVIWVGTQGGVAKKLNGTFQGYGVSGGLPANRVRKVYSDDPSNLWAGFIEGGAALLRP